MVRRRKRYTREFRLEAIQLAETNDKSIAEIERDLGLGSGQIHHWRPQLANECEEAFPGKGYLKPQDEIIRQLRRENEVLRQERDISKKKWSHFSLCASKAMKSQFIEAHRDEFPVTRTCQVLKVSARGYYASRERPLCQREQENLELRDQIKSERGGIGHATLVTAELNPEGLVCRECDAVPLSTDGSS
jgi:transposase